MQNPDTGAIEPWAQEIIDRFSSYTEASPSGTGVHIIARGTLPDGGRKKGDLEIYGEGRYFTATGDAISTPVIADRQEHIPWLLTKLDGNTKANQVVVSIRSVAPQQLTRPDLSDVDVLRVIRASKQADVFDRLCQGDTGHHPSASEADLHLCGIISFYTRNTEQIKRLWLSSVAIHREKYDRDYYLERTIATALKNQIGIYDPNFGKSGCALGILADGASSESCR